MLSLVVRQPTRGELFRIQFFGELPEVMSIVAFLFPSAERMVGGALRSGFDDFKRQGRQFDWLRAGSEDYLAGLNLDG